MDERAASSAGEPSAGEASPSNLADREKRSSHIAPLTGLRFLAAANVLAFHYAPHPAAVELGNLPLMAYLGVLSCGASAVSLFFVLSGFVLAHRYLADDGSFRGKRATFWLARLRRIAPAYFLGYALALVYLASHAGTDPLAAVASLGLVQSWWGPLARVVNSPGWSLSVEIFFYASFPLLAPPIYRLACRQPVAMVAALLLACLPGPLVLAMVGAADSVASGFWHDTALNLPLLHLPSFLIGVATAAALRTSPRPSARWATPGEILPNVGAFCCLLLISGTLPGPLVRNGALAPWFALLILRLSRDRGLLARVLALPFVVMLGEASYALYILQEPLWNWFSSLLDLLGQSGLSATWPGFACFVLTAVAVSIVVSRSLETLLVRRPVPAGQGLASH